MEIEPVISGDKPTVLIHNILINCGYVESAQHATVICQNHNGFSDPEEALIHLHQVLKAAYIEALRNHDHYHNTNRASEAIKDYNSPQNREFTDNFASWIVEWCGSDNDNSPGGYEPWQVMDDYGWQIPGIITTGMMIDITEKGEHLLASEQQIRNHIKAFRGEFVPLNGSDTWPMHSDLRMYVLTVGEVKPKPIPSWSKK